MENRKNKGTVAAGAKEIYEFKVGLESFKRAGYNRNLKGIAHEVMYKDLQNLKPSNITSGAKSMLSKSPTAVRDDVLLIKAGKIIGRSQLKDTPGSIAHTVKQVASGKYQGTVLRGTKETVKAYNVELSKAASRGLEISQKMKSTGISSADTARVASKVVGGNLTGGLLQGAAKSSGVAGAALSCGIETISAGNDYLNGDIDGYEFASRVAKETVGGGLSAAAGGVAATTTATVTASVLAATAAPVWIPAAIGIGAAVAVGSLVKELWDDFWS